MKKYKLKLAHWIASSELQKEQSRRNLLFKKMAVSYIVNSLIKILDDEKAWKSDRKREISINLINTFGYDLIKGGRSESNY